MDMKTRKDTWADLSTIYKTCDAISKEENIQNLYTHLENGFLYMAMTDYPYESDFLNPQPAWPVNVSCQAFVNVTFPTI